MQNYHLPKVLNKLQSNLVNIVENFFKNLIVLLMIQAWPKSLPLLIYILIFYLLSLLSVASKNSWIIFSGACSFLEVCVVTWTFCCIKKLLYSWLHCSSFEVILNYLKPFCYTLKQFFPHKLLSWKYEKLIFWKDNDIYL